MLRLLQKISFFWVLVGLTFGCIHLSHAMIGPIHGGEWVEFHGRTYEVVPDRKIHQVRVYTGPEYGPSPGELLLILRRNHRIIHHVHLTLSASSASGLTYTGMIPRRILARNGLQFELRSH